jgi:single-stranded DNA-binding protein
MLSMMFAGNVGGEVAVRDVTVRGESIKVASFSVAVSNGKNAQGEDLPPTWIKVSVWRKYAETVARFVKKGDRVTITAENLKASAWQAEDGELRTVPSGVTKILSRSRFGSLFILGMRFHIFASG